MGAEAIKLGSWDKHPAYCKDWNVNEWHIRNERKCDVIFLSNEPAVGIDNFWERECA